jgi:hypothetical protein
MPGIHHTNSACEIDQAIAVGIRNHCALSANNGYRRDRRNSPGYGLGTAREQGPALGAGNLRNELDDARHLHPEGKDCMERG